MIPINPYNLEISSQAVQKAMATMSASQQFDRAYVRGWLQKVWALLTRRSAQMLNLQTVKAAAAIQSSHYEGIRTVPLDHIRGSENRQADFDVRFNPLRRADKPRWMNVAIAMLADIGLPPVELIQIGDTYFVRDGHHRISAARAFGQKEIDAVVTTWNVHKRPTCARKLSVRNREVTPKTAPEERCTTTNGDPQCIIACS